MPPAIIIVLEELLTYVFWLCVLVTTLTGSSVTCDKLIALVTQLLPKASDIYPSGQTSHLPENLMIPPEHLSAAHIVFLS